MKLANLWLPEAQGWRGGAVQGSNLLPLRAAFDGSIQASHKGGELTHAPVPPLDQAADLRISPSLIEAITAQRGDSHPSWGHGAGGQDAFSITEAARWGAPVASIRTFRDFYAFEAHVKNARARRGLEMVPEWYDAPAFYFSNPNSLIGHDEELPRPTQGEWLDFELEIGCIIGREGRNIEAHTAEEWVAGYTIINDWSLRDVQRAEMKVGLGPAKGKDFATTVGPFLVTPDELADRRSLKGYDLAMVARVNGRELSRGNWNQIHFSFGEMIARASQDVTLYPGDLIGSGTVGTGCILELGPDAVGGWLQRGDVVELEVERLGVLRNRIG